MLVKKSSTLSHQPADVAVSELQAPAICRLWAFRVVFDLNGLSKLLTGHRRYMDDGVAELLAVDPDSPALSSAIKARKLLKANYQQLLQTENVDLPPVFARNLAMLARVAGLNPTEQDVLAFMLLSHSIRPLKETLELLGNNLVKYQLAEVLSVLLQQPIMAVKDALSHNSALLKSGILVFNNYGQRDFCEHFEFVSDHLPDLMMAPLEEPMTLLRDLIAPTKAPQLKEKDYSHLAGQVTLLKNYLKKAVSKRQFGVNVLLYGPPGTGKTELSKVLAKALKQDLYEVSCSNFEGEPIDGMQRLKAARAAQMFLSNGNCMLLFDEVEDVFQQSPFGRTALKECKGWINQLLENNKIPTFWLSNNISALDNAYIRRFDIVLELPVPPATQRANILQQASGGLLNKEEALQLTAHQQLSPAVITRASKVVHTLGSASKATAKAQFTQLTNATLKAQGFRVTASKTSEQVKLYDPRLTQADCDLVALNQGLQQAGAGRLCLYGPPGTGKTAFGHYLAKTMGKALLVKKGSDLISCWVGATEQAIAEAFAEASANNSILLMDEVDSFLQERSRARNSWEITGVNEMLTQMEAFEGIFIAST
ncbi:MAG: ATP-binding protein, partial [Alkalimonas sp.]|nr:ATP-binding protein [Alkalimonas sp.]